MPRFIKITSLSLIMAAVGASYYYYFVNNDGYYYQKSLWKQIDDKVTDILQQKDSTNSVFEENRKRLRDKTAQELVARPMSETAKDIWNEQIRNSLEWFYSWGK
ncbi:hypothetical protein KAFR_0C04330 [Kazachstania africana CBS 2517]|uniref:MICOS complex subunit MIC12 n=1 Tax=Kazachstania africana (strain ATCC 22294 / BCRC 22015 / CBS 2517 / CECT 1963 / NBRC 1671 / NRRL Y-8276) TaxID=1071382 RepID=H2ASS3_KAZAF|nr:hypothetical protein KAFR_0C04330 [Kazachstania africana CBS 2517]CCF57423.1 hypothetical protein KAFR_0C04330 [Kazachstania africana CBS 2517]